MLRMLLFACLLLLLWLILLECCCVVGVSCCFSCCSCSYGLMRPVACCWLLMPDDRCCCLTDASCCCRMLLAQARTAACSAMAMSATPGSAVASGAATGSDLKVAMGGADSRTIIKKLCPAMENKWTRVRPRRHASSRTMRSSQASGGADEPL